MVDTCSSSSADHPSMVPHLGREATLSLLTRTHSCTETHACVRVFLWGGEIIIIMIIIIVGNRKVKGKNLISSGESEEEKPSYVSKGGGDVWKTSRER